MSINLSGYSNVATGLFVSIVASPTTTLRFSDYNATVVIDTYEYKGLGQFVGITSSSSDLKSTPGGITLTLSGVPSTAISEVNALGLKGAEVIVQRVFFDAVTQVVLPITGNPIGRFIGIVDNYSLNEEYDSDARSSQTTISLTCSSVVDLLENKIAGRKTNPSSNKSYYPLDVSMDRVPALVGANFDFGVPK